MSLLPRGFHHTIRRRVCTIYGYLQSVLYSTLPDLAPQYARQPPRGPETTTSPTQAKEAGVLQKRTACRTSRKTMLSRLHCNAGGGSSWIIMNSAPYLYPPRQRPFLSTCFLRPVLWALRGDYFARQSSGGGRKSLCAPQWPMTQVIKGVPASYRYEGC
jgi:hypothetical protein